tara:strand:+ start:1800 stop:2930 length:1131 start_codon:yes stop_codon:yes gene_type:complete
MKILSYFDKWIKVYDYLALKKSDKVITFYSESKNYWPYLKGILENILKEFDTSIYYVTSDADDPGLYKDNKNYNTLLIDEGFMRDWFFKKLNTHILITTMPDIDNFQIKKSINTDYYVYTQHSMMSPNCSYRKGSFDNYDIIFCCGQYMIDEIRKAEEFYNLPKKELVKHGYTRLDTLIDEYKVFQKSKTNNTVEQRILLAPSWNEGGIIESELTEKIIQSSINEGFQITLRPHPESLKKSPQKIKKILDKFSNDNFFRYEDNIVTNDNLYNSDLLITDWSGIALEYAFALNKPILFVNTPQKILNDDYHVLGARAFEDMIRDKIGIIWNGKETITDVIKKFKNINYESANYIFNIGKSNEVAALFIKDLVKKIIS